MSSPQQAYEYFRQRGYSGAGSAAIVGNLYGESNLRTNAVGDGGKAYGIAQWHPPRQADFARFTGTNIRGSSFEQQLAFVDYELRTGYSEVGNKLRTATDVNSATYAVMRGYERPANDSSYGNRLSAAKKVLGGVGDSLKSGATSAALAIANGIVPGSGEVLKGLGIGGESWLDQFRNWLAESHFWQRIAIGVFALIMIGGALYLFGTGKISKIVKAA